MVRAGDGAGIREGQGPPYLSCECKNLHDVLKSRLAKPYIGKACAVKYSYGSVLITFGGLAKVIL